MSSISATAKLGVPKEIPSLDVIGSKERDKSKNSEPSSTQSGLITIFTVFLVSSGLNVTSIGLLEKSTSVVADCGSDSDGVIMTVYGIDDVPVAITVTGIIPSASSPEYVLELNITVNTVMKKMRSKKLWPELYKSINCSY